MRFLQQLIGWPWLLVVATLAAGCSVITPPPMMMRHEGAAPLPVGGRAFTLIGGTGGGMWLEDAVGGQARLSYQLDEELQLAGGLTAGASVDDHSGASNPPPELLVAGRLSGRYNPAALRWLGLNFGVGGGWADTDLTYLTADTGVVFSYTFFDRLTPYAGPVFAVSTPITAGNLINSEDDDDEGSGLTQPATTWFFGGNVGLKLDLTERWAASAELGVLAAESVNDEGGVLVSLTGGVTYRF